MKPNLQRLKLKPHKLFHHLDEVQAWSKGDYFPPIWAELSVTDRCNQACWYCYVDYFNKTSKLHLADDKLPEVFVKLAEGGLKSIQIQGTGEPMMHPRIIDGMEAGKKAGLSLAMYTNGSLNTEEKLKRVLPCLEWMRVSALELTPDLYARTHGCDASQWKKVMDGVKASVRLREQYGFDTVLGAHVLALPYNYMHLPELIAILKDIGLDYIHIRSVQKSDVYTPDRNFDVQEYQHDFDLYREKIEAAQSLQDDSFLVIARLDEFAITHQRFKKNYSFCHGLAFETVIDADGEVYPCLHFWRNKEYSYGSILEKSFEEVWRGQKRQEVLEKLETIHNLNECTYACKHHHINETLWELAHPPMHVNFL